MIAINVMIDSFFLITLTVYSIVFTIDLLALWVERSPMAQETGVHSQIELFKVTPLKKTELELFCSIFLEVIKKVYGFCFFCGGVTLYQRFKKWYLISPCFKTQLYKVRISGVI